MEIWKDVVGYEGLYQVSSYGNVKSVKRARTIHDKRGRDFEAPIPEKILSTTQKNRYLGVMLYRNNEKKRHLVHRLVAEAFVPNPNNLNEVNHIDENTKNNNAFNLEWVTHKQNMNHGTLPERRRHFNTFKSPIIQLDKNGTIIAEYESIVEASKKTGINKGSISTGLSRNGYCKGFYWKYKINNRKSRRKVGI